MSTILTWKWGEGYGLVLLWSGQSLLFLHKNLIILENESGFSAVVLKQRRFWILRNMIIRMHMWNPALLPRLHAPYKDETKDLCVYCCIKNSKRNRGEAGCYGLTSLAPIIHMWKTLSSIPQNVIVFGGSSLKRYNIRMC
jgi:hypothetical protein